MAEEGQRHPAVRGREQWPEHADTLESARPDPHPAAELSPNRRSRLLGRDGLRVVNDSATGLPLGLEWNHEIVDQRPWPNGGKSSFRMA